MGPHEVTDETTIEPSPHPSEPTEPVTSELTPEQLSNALGPFSPQYEFDHGPEFDSETPRPIPRKLRKGSFQRRRRGVAIVWAVLGSCFMLVANWTIIQNLAFHVLPLQYLGWIGMGMIGISLCLVARNWFSKERYRYVVAGTPFPGRVLQVGDYYTVTINPETKAEQFEVQSRVLVEFDNPETRHREYAYIISEEKWPVAKKDKYTVTIAPGDYVTLVAMPGRINETIKLYGFLGLDPSREYLRYRGKPIAGISPFTALLISMVVFGCLWLFIGTLYVLQGCFPLDWNWPIGLAFMGGGIAVTSVGGWWLVSRDSPQANSRSPFVAVLVFGVFGIFLGLLALCLSNSILDHTEPRFEPITIVNHWQKTHKGMFREYEIEYTEPGQPNPKKSHITRQNQMRLGPVKLAARELRQGSLGLRWIRAYHPCGWVVQQPGEEPAKPDDAVEVDFEKWLISEQQKHQLPFDLRSFFPDLKERPRRTLIPVLILEDRSHAPAPEFLIPFMKQELTQQMSQH